MKYWLIILLCVPFYSGCISNSHQQSDGVDRQMPEWSRLYNEFDAGKLLPEFMGQKAEYYCIGIGETLKLKTDHPARAGNIITVSETYIAVLEGQASILSNSLEWVNNRFVRFFEKNSKKYQVESGNPSIYSSLTGGVEQEMWVDWPYIPLNKSSNAVSTAGVINLLACVDSQDNLVVKISIREFMVLDQSPTNKLSLRR